MEPKWGHTPTECPKCGNRDINRILVWFSWAPAGEDKAGLDATNIGHFFHDWINPAKGSRLQAIEKLTCLKCAEAGRGEVEIEPKSYQI